MINLQTIDRFQEWEQETVKKKNPVHNYLIESFVYIIRLCESYCFSIVNWLFLTNFKKCWGRYFVKRVYDNLTDTNFT